MKPKLDWLLSVLLVLCALVTTTAVVHREIAAPSAASTKAKDRKPIYIQDWKVQLEKGVRLGQIDAPIQLIEFADFECPFCGDFHRVLKILRDRYPAQVALTFVHFPLPMHRFAVPAARVAECADVQGRFEAMYDRLFDEQGAFGLKPWDDYATEAGVPDLPAFDTCIKRTDAIPRIFDGRALGTKLDVNATPTLIVNGWLLGRPPSIEELDAMVRAVLAGKDPFSGAQKS